MRGEGRQVRRERSFVLAPNHAASHDRDGAVEKEKETKREEMEVEVSAGPGEKKRPGEGECGGDYRDDTIAARSPWQVTAGKGVGISVELLEIIS